MKKWIEKYSILLSLLLVLGIMGMIFYMSAQPAEASGAMSGGFTTSILSWIVPNFEEMTPEAQRSLCGTVEVVIRKLAHFSEYAVLGFALLLHIHQIEKRTLVRLPWLWAWCVVCSTRRPTSCIKALCPGEVPG